MSTEATVARLMAMIAAYASYASRNATQQQAVMLHADIEAALREALDLGELVAIFMFKHATPEGTREFWGYLEDGIENLPAETPLYAPKAKP